MAGTRAKKATRRKRAEKAHVEAPQPVAPPPKTTGETTGIAKIPQPHGGALNAGGTPGNKGGRPRNEFIEWCEELLNDPATREAAAAILKDKDHRAFKAMFSEVADRVHGKAKQNVELSGSLKLEDLVTQSRR
jgi:hypothetical protein